MSSCARETCDRLEQNGGLCRHHYRIAMVGKPTGLVDSAPVIEHMRKLSQSGISGNRLGKLVGMSQVSIWRINRQEKVLAATAAKIMAVKPSVEMAADNALVPALPYSRRLQALQVLGYTTEDLAKRLGTCKRSLVEIHRQRFVTGDLARRLIALYDKLHLIPGPNKVTRDRSLRKGWVTPLAWNDIDDPNEQPFVELPNTRSESLLHALDALALGRSEQRVAADLGITVDGLRKKVARHGGEDVRVAC